MQSPSDTLNSLLDLAAAEGFWGMPGFTHCSGTLPDAAAHFVQITSNTGTTRVTVHGSCNSSFNRIWANLNAVVDLTR
jgi:argininosuccinate lyase